MDQINHGLEEYDEEVIDFLCSMKRYTFAEAQEISATHEDILIKGFNENIEPQVVALDMHNADVELKKQLVQKRNKRHYRHEIVSDAVILPTNNGH